MWSWLLGQTYVMLELSLGYFFITKFERCQINILKFQEVSHFHEVDENFVVNATMKLKIIIRPGEKLISVGKIPPPP